MKKNIKLEAKDLITIGIFSALYCVGLIISAVANLTPITYMFYPAVSAFITAVIYLLLITKVPKHGSIMILGIIVALLYFVLGMPLNAPFVLVGALIASVISGKTGYKHFWANTIGYIIFSVSTVGGYLQLIFSGEELVASGVERGLNEQFMNTLVGYATIPYLLLSAFITIIFAALGSLYAKALLKKHLLKAGVV